MPDSALLFIDLQRGLDHPKHDAAIASCHGEFATVRTTASLLQGSLR